MWKLFVAVLLLCCVSVNADKPVDLPCVTWVPLSSSQPTDTSDLFLAAYTWILVDRYTHECTGMGNVYPCFATDNGVDTWGHHDYSASEVPYDYCRSWFNGKVVYSDQMYVPKKGPQWKTWEWVIAEKGGPVPLNAIRYGDKVLAQSTVNAPGECAGKGFTGWAHGLDNGTFGSVHFSTQTRPDQTDSFKVAVCKAWHPTTTVPPTTTTPPPTTPPPTSTKPNTTTKPTTPPTTVPTTLPPTTPAPTLPNVPFIRFAHVIPDKHHVDAIVTRGNQTFEWNNTLFGFFSPWEQVMNAGNALVEIYENDGGNRTKKLLEETIFLTPGPLIIALKDHWPPQNRTNIETIAASYTPIGEMSGVRLFNLSPDTKSAGQRMGTQVIADRVVYTLGSGWWPLPIEQATFTAFDDNHNKTLGKASLTPPDPPYVFTNYLIGLQDVSDDSPYATRLVPLIDAPEF